MSFGRSRQYVLNRRIQFIPQSTIIILYFVALGPIARSVARQSTPHGIDAKRKKVIKRSLRRRQPKRALRQQVPVKCFDVSKVKNDPVPLWNGPVVYGLVAHNLKQIIRLRARAQQAGM
jgi:hypothetical protein